MNSDQVGGIIRAIVSALGGFLVGKGYIDGGAMTALAGAFATIGIAVWSYFTNQPGTKIPSA